MTHFENFINKATAKFGAKYDYSNVDYINSGLKVTIVCPKHGDFQQTPDGHVASKHGCRLCGIEAAADAKRKTLKDFVERSKEIHNNFYDYSKTVYKEAKEKVIITCPVHGDFEQLVSGHLSGYGCKRCSEQGKGRIPMDKPAKLYYFNILGTSLYKIGITSRTIEERYRTSFDRDQINIIFVVEYPTGRRAYEEETNIKKTFASLAYSGEKVLSTGNTEIFCGDIFNGDYTKYTEKKEI